jgi:hypothetical protein
MRVVVLPITKHLHRYCVGVASELIHLEQFHGTLPDLPSFIYGTSPALYQRSNSQQLSLGFCVREAVCISSSCSPEAIDAELTYNLCNCRCSVTIESAPLMTMSGDGRTIHRQSTKIAASTASRKTEEGAENWTAVG